MATKPLDLDKLRALCEDVIRHIPNKEHLPIAQDWDWAELTHKSLPELRDYLVQVSS